MVTSSNDTLSMFHHVHHFEVKLHHLLNILESPKEEDLKGRFQKISAIIDDEFYHDLNKHSLIQSKIDVNNLSNSRPRLLLQLHFFLECTDSIESIAHFLEISPSEVFELIRELHNTFSIDNIKSRIQAYYEHNKQNRELPQHLRQEEYLGTMPSYEPKDTTEDRRKRLRKKYGYVDKL